MSPAQPQRGAVLITGAAGGIGAASARILAAQGFHVIAGVRKPADGEALQRSIAGRVTPILLDITDPAAIATAATRLHEILGGAGLRGLVNNAGLIVEGPVELIPIEEVRRQFEVNVIGQIAVTQALLPLLRQARGRIINIGAVSGQTTVPFLGVLSASKSALESLTDALRVELQPWGIDVCIVEPAAMRTSIFEKSNAAAQQSRQQIPGHLLQLYAPALAAIQKTMDGQPMDSPDTVANIVLQALTARRPRTRYVVGPGARLVVALRLLPDRLRDSLILRVLGIGNVSQARPAQ